MSTNIIRGNIQSIKHVRVTIDPAAIAAATSANNSVTATVPGLKTTDLVVPFKPTTTAGVTVVGARPSAANTLQIVLGNFTAGSLDPGAEAWDFLVIRTDATGGVPADAL